MTKKILITGANGDVGKELVVFLKKYDYEVFSFVRKKINKKDVLGDICNCNFLVNATKDIDIVIHLAGLIKGNKKNLQKINIKGTKNLIEACKKNKVNKIIYISSLDIKFNTNYGISKKIAEEIVKNSGLEYVILRPSLMYGENFKKGIPELINLIKKSFIIPVPGNGKNLFCPLYVNDLNLIIYQIIDKNKFNKKTYFICGNSEISMNNLIDLIDLYLNKNITKIHFPVVLMKKVLNLFGININMIDNACINKTESNNEIKKDFNFNPIGIENGVRMFFKENEFLRAKGI